MDRKDLIIKIVKLHNWATIEFFKYFEPGEVPNNLIDENLLIIKFDRFFLVEKPTNIGNDYDNKKFQPKVEVRYHLRSKEAKQYGAKDQRFYDRYLSTYSFLYEDLEQEEQYKINYIADLEKTFSKKEKIV